MPRGSTATTTTTTTTPAASFAGAPFASFGCSASCASASASFASVRSPLRAACLSPFSFYSCPLSSPPHTPSNRPSSSRMLGHSHPPTVTTPVATSRTTLVRLSPPILSSPSPVGRTVDDDATARTNRFENGIVRTNRFENSDGIENGIIGSQRILDRSSISFPPCRNSGRSGPGGYKKGWVDTEFSKQISSPLIHHPASISSNPVRPLSIDKGRKQGICCRVGIDSLIIDSETVENNNKSIKDQEKITRQNDLQAQMRFSKKEKQGHEPKVQEKITSQELQKNQEKSRKEVKKKNHKAKKPAKNPKNQK